MDKQKEFLENAVDKGWLVSLANTPHLVFKNPMANLVNAIKRILIEHIAKKQKFEEWIFPRMIPEEVLAKTGWLNYHREEAWIVSPKREYLFKPDQNKLFNKISEFPISPISYVLDPIQCVSLYYALYGKSLNMSDLPIKIYEHQGGWSFRHEARPLGLDRSLEFLRLEFVWIAIQDDAINIRNILLEDAADTLAEQLHLDVYFYEGDSCFEEPSTTEIKEEKLINRSEIKNVFHMSSVDIVVKYNNRLIEVSSAGRHDKLPKRFEIKINKGDGDNVYPWSGCLGIGITRLAYAFLSVHGFEVDEWDKNCPIKRLFKDYEKG